MISAFILWSHVWLLTSVSRIWNLGVIAMPLWSFPFILCVAVFLSATWLQEKKLFSNVHHLKILADVLWWAAIALKSLKYLGSVHELIWASISTLFIANIRMHPQRLSECKAFGITLKFSRHSPKYNDKIKSDSVDRVEPLLYPNFYFDVWSSIFVTLFVKKYIVYTIADVPYFYLFGSIHPSTCLHLPRSSPHYYWLCPWAVNIANPFTFLSPVPPHLLPLTCIHTSGSVLSLSLFGSLDSTY